MANEDIADWIALDGPNGKAGPMSEKMPHEIRERIMALAAATPIYTPPAPEPDTPDAAAQEDAQAAPVILPAYFTAADLVVEYPSQREPIIDGLLRRGEVGNLVSASKANKSWLLLHIGLCVATGRNVFNFQTRPGRVLLLDYELAPGTLAKRLLAVADAMGLSLADIGDRLAIEPLRGKRLDIDRLRNYFAALPPGRFDCIIIDPLYRTFPEDIDENSNANMAALYGDLQAQAEKLDAGFLVVHHLSKGDQSGKAVTDLGAGGGSQSRAADAHLALRPHKEDGAAVIVGVVRSFPPFAPFAIRWNFPQWELAPDLNPADLYRPSKKNHNPSKNDTPPVPPAPTWDAARFVVEFLTMTPKPQNTIIAAATAKGLSGRKAGDLLALAEDQGKAHRWNMGKDRRAHYANCPQPKLTEAGQADGK